MDSPPAFAGAKGCENDLGVVIPAEAGIHESRGGRGTSIQAGIHTASIEHEFGAAHTDAPETGIDEG